ncbi:MAG: DUF1553 domain-containing protein [Planctomycetota bacterium]|nr:MAG: DUF1553 domain-containing protein [Planctomycetota bacterium]
MTLTRPNWRFAAAFGSLRSFIWTAASTFALAGLASAAAIPQQDGAVPDFNRDIRPILSDNCFYCHGPDREERKAGLRLDVPEGALGELSGGGFAIVPGELEESELWFRVDTDDDFDVMPPPGSGKSLTDREKQLLKQWIEAGAPFAQHWAFVAPKRPALPEVERQDLVRNPVDRFLLNRLQAEGLSFNPEADRETLLRRLSLDLTGLPPTPEELDAFLADEDSQAYERQVQRLLDSPKFGEHMARYWLDAARYGDTHGFHLDNERSLWPWRDWVIQSFNDNKPFDEFTIEQLAGDLLPNPTLQQRVATGFNRCNPTTGEGGLIEEEYLVKYAMDRVETTSTVWMGLTMNCASCHDHKFDPFSQEEYYRIFAFFHNVAEEGTDRNALTPPPVIKAPLPEQQVRIADLEQRLQLLEQEMASPMPEVDAAQSRWEQQWRQQLAKRWMPAKVLEAKSLNGAELQALEDGSYLVAGPSPDKDVQEFILESEGGGFSALRLEALPDESLPLQGIGRADNANFVLSGVELEVLAEDGSAQAVPLAVASASYNQPNYPVSAALDGKDNSGWAISARREAQAAVFQAERPFLPESGGRLRVRLRYESPHLRHVIGRVRLLLSRDPDLVPTQLGAWSQSKAFSGANGNEVYRQAFPPETHLDDLAACEAAEWQPKPDYVDGKVHTFTGDDRAIYLYRSLTATSARRLQASFGSDDALKVWLNGDVVLDRNVQRAAAPDQDRVDLHLRAGVNHLLLKVVNYKGGFGFAFRRVEEEVGDLPMELAFGLEQTESQRPIGFDKRLREFYRNRHAPAFQALLSRRDQTNQELAQLDKAVPRTMVMAERMESRPTFFLNRGQYDNKGEQVSAGVPSVLLPLPKDQPVNRLSLARWLMDPRHPLPARVTVNRFWQNLFGVGIVGTAEDFGSQGEWPSHPQLLDWLAVEFMESGWNVKHMIQLMVESNAYRQSSRVSSEKLAADPNNRFLSRGPRFRMDAEMVRDLALKVSGLLVERIGGPSVKPYQPEGLWVAVAYPSSNTSRFVQDEGEDLYRRSLYTFWKRTAPPPNMVVFDAPTRESCTVRRPRTNTPLQALTLLNDVQFVEASRFLAQRMMKEGGEAKLDRIHFGFRLATGRHPDLFESSVLLEIFQEQWADFQADPEAAREFLKVGDRASDPQLPVEELAAWTMVANTLLNLDETINKG